ncbi:hypothetical protein [Nitratifractor salsuginis]|uniref:HEAT repeat domain-containing protein n=1 Tax=Nitratifractor salsuginis (strain DSM 16511 / JCM 12458 / E9I37-1) TaxID=749222 RepID=E6WZW3_NITSE|nr:hypothetical protein [Nitratifractor salsuginis]ADV45621.1 hypothetical protein Nitsa_0351 [Nitratifractor salsuginis DSM 16511]
MIYLSSDDSYDILAARGMMCSDENDVYQFLNDKDYRVRTLAAQTIQTKYPTKKSFDIAKEMIESNQADKIELGTYILGQLGTPNMPFWRESFPLLENIVNTSNDKKAIASALYALSHLCSLAKCKIDEKLLSKIIEYTKDENKDVAIAALLTLSSQPGNKKVEDTIKHIIFESDDANLRDWAETALEIIRD